jgi:hypothetical protein
MSTLADCPVPYEELHDALDSLPDGGGQQGQKMIRRFKVRRQDRLHFVDYLADRGTVTEVFVCEGPDPACVFDMVIFTVELPAEG